MFWPDIGILAAMGTAVLWTLSALAWTSAGKRVGALPVSFIRLVISCVFLLAYGKIVRGQWLPLDASAELWCVLGLSGFFGYFLADVCLFKAFLLIGPRLALLIQSLTPPLAAVLSAIFLRDTLGAKDLLGMVITLTGVTWVVLEQPESQADAIPRRHAVRGVLLSLLAAFGQAVGLVLAKRGASDYDAVAATFIRVIGALAGYIVLTTLVGRWSNVAKALPHARVMVILTLGALVGPFVGAALCMVAMRHCPAGIVATIIGTMPVLILPPAIFLYHEKVTWRAAGGAALSVVGVAVLVL